MTQEVWNKIINSEMLLIGIGTQLSVKEDNEKDTTGWELDGLMRYMIRWQSWQKEEIVL